MMTKTKHKFEHKHKSFHLAEPERILWQKVTATVRPLLPELRNRAVETKNFLDGAMMKEMFGAADTASLIQPASSKKLEKSEKNTHKKISLNKPATVALPIYSRKAQRKIARQHFDGQARLDLHGASQDKAYDFLLHFIRANFARNQSLVLVITGKGQRTGGVGVLRQLVPQWLETPPFRLYVSAVEGAARHHGGEGAFYVKLRRNSSGTYPLAHEKT